jgi:DNA-binding NarL/FixJ family response regulator
VSGAAAPTGPETAGHGTIRVLLADDQQLVRAGLAMIINARDDMAVVAEASDGVEAVELARRHRPDVILMDVRMPRLDGVAAATRLIGEGCAARIVMLTTFDLDEPVLAALRGGASGFLLKDIRPAELAEAVRVVARGDAMLAPTVTRRLLDRFAAGWQPPSGSARSGAPAERPAAVEALSSREVEFLTLMARALSNAEIARALTLSEATVKTHVSAILAKLNLRDRVQAAVFAYDVGLVRPRPSS